MTAITAVASRGTFSAGTLLALGGGLLLYQMTSLVLGPAGSPQLHVSLTIPAIEVNEPSLSLASGVNVVVGSVTAPVSTGVPRRPAALHRAPSRPAAHPSVAPVAPKPTAVVKIPALLPPAPVGSPASSPDEQVEAHNQHDRD